MTNSDLSLQEEAHSIKIKELLDRLQTSENGLDNSAVLKARDKYGENKLYIREEITWIKILLSQFNLIVIILLISSIIAFSTKHFIDSVGILFAAILSVFFGFIQEYKAEKALKALTKISAPKASVIRNSKQIQILASEIVPGDIILLREGDLVPADARIIKGENLEVNQSILTGESTASDKRKCRFEKSTPLTKRDNIVYASTFVLKSDARAVVFATGKNTEFGKIAKYLSDIKKQDTPLKKNLDELAQKMIKICILLVGLFFAFGSLRGERIVDLLLVTVALFVAAIPEGLPTVLAITLAIGVNQMAKKKALMRRMQSVETMGSATVICTDKTGTLTENKMMLVRLESFEQDYKIYIKAQSKNLRYEKNDIDKKKTKKDIERIKRILTSASLCNSASINFSTDGKVLDVKGGATESAILIAANRFGINIKTLKKKNKKICEFRFEHNRKRMSQIRENKSKIISYVKGAPEVIIKRCKYIFNENGKQVKLSYAEKRRLYSVFENYSREALRTLAVASKELKSKKRYSEKDAETDLTWIGLLGIVDPPRKGVKDALRIAQKAGIRVIMLTGDAPLTAKVIAQNLGLITNEEDILTGEQIEKLSDYELRKRVKDLRVCARATPAHKFRIIRALQTNSEIVAVTGDGVNDAPALKRADIGIAMGVGGTDVAKGAADMILTDNNFGTIVYAIEMGRTIFENIQSFIRFQFTTNIAALIVMFSAPFMGLAIPLNALQILWINIIMDGPPALALGLEPSYKSTMMRKPRDPKLRLVNKRLMLSIFSSAILMAILTLGAYVYYKNTDPIRAGTMAFTTFVILQLTNALVCRSAKNSAFENLLSNKLLIATLIITFLLQYAIIVYPSAMEVFSTQYLTIFEWRAIFAAAAIFLIWEEIKKKVFPKMMEF